MVLPIFHADMNVGKKNLKFAGKPSKVWPFCFDQLDCLKRLNYPSMKREPLVLRNCGTLKQK